MTTSTSIQPSDALIGGACHFLAIPAEVRLQIYLLLLLFSSPIDIGRRGCYTIMRAIWDHAKLNKNCAAILFCCKHIRSEALPIFYGRNSFSIMLSTDIPRYLASRYSNVLKLSLIRHLVVHVKFSSQYNKIMDETRAEEMKCFVGLQRLTVIRTRIYPERCDGFTQLAIDEVVQGTASKGLKAILIERPSITCRLITVNDVQGSPFRIKKPRTKQKYFKIDLQNGDVAVSSNKGGQVKGEENVSLAKMATTFTEGMREMRGNVS